MATNERVKAGVLMSLVVAALAAGAPPRVVYVDYRATGANDGSSWEDAFWLLQDALLTAGPGDEVRVAQGTYLPTLVGVNPPPRAGGERTVTTAGESSRRGMSFDLRHGGALKGGYAGLGATDANERDFELYETILSGDVGRDDPEEQPADGLFTIPERDDNSMNVVTINRVGPATLDGFTIRGGQAQNGGGGLRIENASPIVRNCTFVHNWGSDGGGVFIYRGHPTIQNCRFLANAARTRGAGLCMEEGSIILADCEFLGNWAGSHGAGASTLSADISVSGCDFRENVCTHGAGLHHVRGHVHVADSTFTDNSAVMQDWRCSGRGGALYISLSSDEESTLTDCLFVGNVACSGGAVRGQVTVARNCRFTGNLAHEDGGVLDGTGAARFENCVFDGNRSVDQFALAKHFGPLLLINCTVTGNESPEGALIHASGLHGAPVDIALINCIVWPAKLVTPGGPDRFWPDHTVVRYSNVQGGWPGEPNIDVDPCFVEPGYWDTSHTRSGPGIWVGGDYHLKSQAGRWDPDTRVWVQDEVTSPCIDAGDPLSRVGPEPFPNGGRVNMGAYGGTVEASKSWSDRLASYVASEQ